MDLRTLIAATKGTRSYEDLARAGGGAPQAMRWWSLASEELKVAPNPATIQSIARALGVTEQTVWMAVGESLGLAVADRSSKLQQLIPPGTERLSDEAVASVLSLLRVLLAQAQVLRELTEPPDPEEDEPEPPLPIRRARKG